MVGGAGRPHSPFSELPPKTKLFWRELVMKREERKSGKKRAGVLEGREKPCLTCLLGSSRPA